MIALVHTHTLTPTTQSHISVAFTTPHPFTPLPKLPFPLPIPYPSHSHPSPYSLFPIPPIPYSLFPIPYSPIPYSLFPIPYPPFPLPPSHDPNPHQRRRYRRPRYSGSTGGHRKTSSNCVSCSRPTSFRAASHQLNRGGPIAIQKRDENSFAIGGTPADCTRVALSHLCPEAKWVLSGINAGGQYGSRHLRFGYRCGGARSGVDEGTRYRHFPLYSKGATD